MKYGGQNQYSYNRSKIYSDIATTPLIPCGGFLVLLGRCLGGVEDEAGVFELSSEGREEGLYNQSA